MVAHRRVNPPPPKCAAKLVEYRRVATWDPVCDDASDTVEQDVINTEVPDKVLDVANVLLVGLGRK